ncbi:putative monooxygenase [Aspergillus ambiguus]|uniref:flavin-containing monooxygenase n=1 Tax=Aspergillus ambiguus TaxID=176160 RepID=UPI003CCCEA16
MNEPAGKAPIPSYSQIACIGTGLSSIALGATLKRWYGLEDIRFFERNSDCGGTWYINSYPGCACDVPSALYSFSWHLNPKWTKLMPSNKEIKAYQDEVIETYGLKHKMTFSVEVKECIWRDDVSLWRLSFIDLRTGETLYHECQILFAATGPLVQPRPCDIPEAETFEGAIFHSARWRDDISLEGKKVVVLGNGCTAAQIVPEIVDKTESLHQIIRSKHWIFPAANFIYPRFLRWIFQYIPLAMKLHRLHIFLMAENDFRLFPMTKAAAKRREARKQLTEKYMRERAPEKYHDLLIPDFDVGCKRRIFDPGYLKSLHNDKLVLTDANITKIVPKGLETTEGFIPADVIVLATGFQTNKYTPYMQVHGKNGTLEDHWKQYDGPGAYNCTAMSGFPNYFLLLGPNSATGHTSALMAAENSVNYALRILKPVLDGKATCVELKQEAENKYVLDVQNALRQTVWNAGCASWYVNSKGWNSMAYPWSQAHYWYRSLFPIWSDWKIKKSKKPVHQRYLRPFILFVLAAINAAFVHAQVPAFWPWAMTSAKEVALETWHRLWL